ncbi:MAG: hypothetical protein U1F66_04770 [bacterium]
MKTLENLKKKITLTLLALACGLVAQTAKAMPVLNEMGSSDYVRVTIPEASLAEARIVYTINGEKVEAFPSDGEVVKLHAEKDGILGKLYFSAYEEAEGSFQFQMTGTQPMGLDHYIHFKSTNESAQWDGSQPLYINAVGATVEVVPVGGQDEIINEPPQSILLGDQIQNFSKVGFLEIRFKVQAAEQPEDGQNPDNNDGGNNGDGNVDGPQASSGGCSMLVGASSGSSLNLAAWMALSGLGLTLRRRAARK